MTFVDYVYHALAYVVFVYAPLVALYLALHHLERGRDVSRNRHRERG